MNKNKIIERKQGFGTMNKEEEIIFKKTKKLIKNISMKGKFSLPRDKLKNMDKKELKKGYFNIGNYNDLSVDNKLIIALFFGYCCNIAVYAGGKNKDSKQYLPKFSDLKGKISKTTLGQANIKPPFVIYHTFSISDNKKQGNSLEIVSHLPQELALKFYNK